MANLGRIQKEYRDFNKNSNGTIFISPQDDSLINWKGTILGPPETPYEGGVFHLSIILDEYPMSKPKIKFITKIYHPQVRLATGEISIDILLLEWTP